MRDILRKLLEKWACCHEWKPYQISKTYDNYYDKRPSKIEHTLVCQKCGKIKKITI